MDYCIESTIEKIKKQENDIENKLRERRTYEETIVSLNRGIRLALSQTAKMKQDYLKATTRVDALNSKTSLEKILTVSLTDQLNASTKELQSVKKESEQGISSVWDVRFSLSEAVHNVSDECDIWALFVKPQNFEIPQIKRLPIETNKEPNVEEEKIKELKEKLVALLAERDRLNCEPDCGEEFKRIRNALRYSAEMTANLNKI